jgi:hypothetical protein
MLIIEQSECIDIFWHKNAKFDESIDEEVTMIIDQFVYLPIYIRDIILYFLRRTFFDP